MLTRSLLGDVVNSYMKRAIVDIAFGAAKWKIEEEEDV